MKPYYERNRIKLFCGDCRSVLAELPESSFDRAITDPPYELGFMGKSWDSTGVAFQPETWKAVLRVLKPGAMLLAFGGTRTFHRLTCAIEDAGFEVRDCLMYLYGSGFPKSHNFGCKCNAKSSHARGGVRSVPEAVSQTPVLGEEDQESLLLSSVQRSTPGPGLGSSCTQGGEGKNAGIVSQCSDEGPKESSLEGRGHVSKAERKLPANSLRSMPFDAFDDGENGRIRDGAPACGRNGSRASPTPNGMRSSPQPQATGQQAGESSPIQVQPGSQVVRGSRVAASDLGRCEACGGIVGFSGYGTALKPAYEPIILAMKPLDGTFAANAVKHGVAGLNIDGGRIGDTGGTAKGNFPKGESNGIYGHGINGKCDILDIGKGRWPANVLLDDEAAALLDLQTGVSESRIGKPRSSQAPGEGWGMTATGAEYADIGGASRFFYTAKASSSERGKGNTHSTVKPLALMKYLLTLTETPTGGNVLDCFAGSGTTLRAAQELGVEAVGIELDEAHCKIIVDRIPRQEVLFA